MPEDIEVGVRLKVDEEEVENIQDQELGIGGGGAGLSEQAELDEERNERLQRVNRGIGRIASKLGVLTVIAAALGVLAGVISQVFDISFSDVREAIVNLVNDLGQKFANFIQGLPTGVAGSVLGEDTANRLQGATVGAAFGGPGALIGSILADQGSQGGNNGGQGNVNVGLFTSRDSLLGDSTQQEMEGKATDAFNLVGGASGGSVPE